MTVDKYVNANATVFVSLAVISLVLEFKAKK